MSYPGGKGHLYQNLINLIPPHETYIEPFLGGGAVMRHKRPARLSIGIDLSLDALNSFPTGTSSRVTMLSRTSSDLAMFTAQASSGMTVLHCGDALQVANELVHLELLDEQTFIYCDPPYLMSTRRSQRPLYEYEMARSEHVDLLSLTSELSLVHKCKIMISSYKNDLYDRWLRGWQRASFDSWDRGGNWREEVVWMNYEQPSELHDYSYLGCDFRERERIKRKRKRWIKNFEQMTRYERLAFVEQAKALFLI